METKGINILKRTLRENQGADVVVCISHALYGDQKINVKLDCILSDEQIGFCIGEQKIYINQGKIKNYGIKDNIYFADDIMRIDIKLNRAV